MAFGDFLPCLFPVYTALLESVVQMVAIKAAVEDDDHYEMSDVEELSGSGVYCPLFIYPASEIGAMDALLCVARCHVPLLYNSRLKKEGRFLVTFSYFSKHSQTTYHSSTASECHDAHISTFHNQRPLSGGVNQSTSHIY